MKTKFKMISLGNLCIEKPQYGSGSKKVDFDGMYQYIRITDITESGKLKDQEIVSPSNPEEKYLLEDGDFLIARSGSVGRTYLHKNNGRKCIYAGYLIRFKLDKNKILPKFLFFYTQSPQYKEWIHSMKKDATLSNINAKEYSSLLIPVPDLPTQEKIVAILERAEKLKEKREKVNKETQEIIQSIFYDMFGDPVKNEKGWDVKNFIDFSDKSKHSFKRGPFGGALKKEIFVPRGYKIYEQKNAIQNDFDIGEYFIPEEKYQEMLAFSVDSGDLIISCSGTIGKIAIIPNSFKKGIINQALLKVTPDLDVVCPLFLKIMLEMPSTQYAIFGKIQGSGIKNMPPMKTIKTTKLICPPLEEQNKFVKAIKLAESLFERQQNADESINTLFDALMQKAFKGELVS